MSVAALLNPAGGVRYHTRALRYAKELWQPFRWSLGEWLLGWQPSEPTLVLVGPSGGYNLQPFLLERFTRVVCLEPDPLARAIFRFRLRRAPLERQPELEFVADDHLVAKPERFVPLLESLGACCVLFSNVIGQLRPLLGATERDAPALAAVRAAVRAAIADRGWASFHDRFSGERRLAFEGALLTETRPSDDELLERVYETSEGGEQRIELVDHLTDGFFPSELPHAYFSWELEPGSFHLIEAVHSLAAER